MTNIASNVDLPTEAVSWSSQAETKKPNKRQQIESKKESPVKDLLNALKFLLPTQKKVESSIHNFCIIRNGWAVAENEFLTIGHPISENLNVCPNLQQLIDALSIVENDISFTHLAENALSIKSGAFKAVVPCYASEYINIEGPDQQVAQIDNKIKDAFSQLAGICNERGKTPHEASILLQANTCVSTDGYAILEYWHGIDLPPNILIPKLSARSVAKAPYDLTGFGFSENSATFYFNNGAFIKTQLIDGNWPEYLGAVTCPFEYKKCHADFIEAVKFAESFSATGNVFMMGDYVRSSPEDQMVSIYTIGNLPPLMGFKAKLIYRIKHAIDGIAFYGNAINPKMFFSKGMLRGALAGVSLEADKYNRDNNVKFEPENLCDDEFSDDIPF